MTWALIAFNALAAWMIGTFVASAVQHDQNHAVASGVVFVYLLLWFMGFVVLSLVWFMTKPKEQS